MTSKEAFIKIREIMNEYHHQFVKENIQVETIEGYPLDQIEKDLEVLEILKDNALIFDNSVIGETSFGETIKGKYIQIYIDEYESPFERIKEWLEDDCKRSN